MTEIKYVCLSDLHLGEEDSLLTALVGPEDGAYRIKPLVASPVMLRLVDCLKVLISQTTEPPTLILAGDILELALAETREAAMVFERFCELLLVDRRLVGDIVYIPGNHDHHIWELAREAQYVEYEIKQRTKPEIKEPHHNTKMFDTKPLTSNLLTSLLKTNLKLKKMPDLKPPLIKLAYPNYAIPSNPKQRCVIFHHGHFIEPIYHLMTELRDLLYRDHQRPVKIWEVEGENFAWIDFFWSQLGRSGEAGAGIERAYEKMKDKDRFNELLCWVAGNAARKHEFLLPRKWRKVGLGHVNDWLEEHLLRCGAWLALRKFKTAERHKKEPGRSGLPLSESASEGLRKYVSGPLREQIFEECDDVWGDIPYETTFVFGHTHKPFEGYTTCEEYAQRLRLYNTGGWVVDEHKRNERHGGSIILIDEDLTVVSVRMYNEKEHAGDYAVSVKEVSGGPDESDFCRHIRSLVDPDADPWKAFSAAVGGEIDRRGAFLKQKIEQHPGRCKP